MKFIDLFSGLGGFHVALKKLGHHCVFASEIDSKLRELYKINFGIMPVGDINGIDINNIPSHDILCAGFPCQPFSKAGAQKGVKDAIRGTLFEKVIEIIHLHNPKYFIIENVPNFLKHCSWEEIKKIFVDKLDYYIDYNILSPHHFNIPQRRERLFIIGSKESLSKYVWPLKKAYTSNITKILTKNSLKVEKLQVNRRNCLNLWQKFIKSIPNDVEIISPIWLMEYGATYPYKETTPSRLKTSDLFSFKGSFGHNLIYNSKEEQNKYLPEYAKSKRNKFPEWKINIIKTNRNFFNKYSIYFRHLIKDFKKLPASWQKLEWNCKGEKRNIFNYLIQFRASGIRIKRTNYSPSLVALNLTQVPIIAKEKRYLTSIEAARLQSLSSIELPKDKTSAFRALGNAVNSEIIFFIAKKLFKDEI